MDGLAAQPLRRSKVGAARLRCQIHDQAAGLQSRQHRLGQHRGRDGVHHRIKGRSQRGQPGKLCTPQAKALGQRTLFGAPGTDSHICPQCRQPRPQRLPHRAKAQQQKVCAPQGTGALGQQDANAALRRRDGIVHRQLRSGKVIHQLHASFLCDGLCLN